MRLTKRQLKKVIREEYTKLQRRGLISEMSSMMGGMNMAKADACCAMDSGSLFDMCAQICDANPSMAGACADLCSSACSGNAQACGPCLDKICECPICSQICSNCCGCQGRQMRMTETKLRRTIRRAILINEGKKGTKKLAKKIANYVEDMCEQGQPHKTCTKEILIQKFGEGTEAAIERLLDKHPSFDEAGGPEDGYYYEVEVDYVDDEDEM